MVISVVWAFPSSFPIPIKISQTQSNNLRISLLPSYALLAVVSGCPIAFKGTVSPDYKCLEVISIKSPLLGDVTPDIKKI